MRMTEIDVGSLLDDELVHALLAMHRYFACSEDLLKGLVRCFEGVRDPMELPKKQPGGDSPHAPTKQPLASKRLARLERILEIWLENYPYAWHCLHA